jgi:hypothetical protein
MALPNSQRNQGCGPSLISLKITPSSLSKAKSCPAIVFVNKLPHNYTIFLNIFSYHPSSHYPGTASFS